MVIQEDAILHSEDVSSLLIGQRKSPRSHEMCFIIGERKSSKTILHSVFAEVQNCVCALALSLHLLQSLRKMSIITTHLQYQ